MGEGNGRKVAVGESSEKGGENPTGVLSGGRKEHGVFRGGGGPKNALEPTFPSIHKPYPSQPGRGVPRQSTDTRCPAGSGLLLAGSY